MKVLLLLSVFLIIAKVVFAVTNEIKIYKHRTNERQATRNS
jgi:hypothetical protein